MKKIALALSLLSSPVLAQQQPQNPAMQLLHEANERLVATANALNEANAKISTLEKQIEGMSKADKVSPEKK